jgi:hypothetical protein
MATTIDLSWYPDPVHVGDGVIFIATLTPTPPAGAHVWIFLDGVNLGQLDTDDNGQASTYWTASGAGGHAVEAAFATLPPAFGDPVDSDSTTPVALFVLAKPAAGPAAQPDPAPSPAHRADADAPQAADTSGRTQSGANALTGVAGVDPFSGAPASDPYTGEPLSARDASINERIRAVYSAPDAVPEATRYAVLDFYNKSALDLTGVPRSFHDFILDTFSQAAQPPLPGRGLDEFFGDTMSSLLGDVSGGVRAAVATTSTAIDVLGNANALELAATAHTLRPFFGAAQAIGGVAEIVAGAAITVGSEGFGAALGAGMSAHGLDQLIAGGRTMLGEDAQSLTQYVLTDALRPGFGPRAALAAGVIDSAVSLGFNAAAEFGEMGGIAARSLSADTAATRAELAALAPEEAKSIVGPATATAAEYAQLPRPEIAFASSEWRAGTKVEQGVAAQQNIAVEYVDVDPVLADNAGANYQVHATGSDMEQVFRITENGEPATFKADSVVNDFLVEAKAGYMGYYRRPMTWEGDMYDQARRYLIVNDIMGYKGVRYAVSDADKVQGLSDLFAQWFPDAMSSGKLSVWWVPQP